MRALLRAPSVAFLAFAASAIAVRSAHAGDPQHVGDVRESVAFDQKLGAQLDLGLGFLDEDGRAVKLGDYFGKKPILLTPVYYGCPQLCSQVLNGLVDGLHEMSLEPGRDYEIVSFSIDPTETPELAREKKAAYVAALGKPDAASAWHFLCADPATRLPQGSVTDVGGPAEHDRAVDALTSTIGFRYSYDAEIQQYAHAAGVVVVTPGGKVSKYLYGIEFLPRDLRLSIVDSSNGKVGTIADQLFLWICYHYDPLNGKYSFAVMSTLRALAVLTVLGLVTYLVRNLWRDRANARLSAGA